MREIIFRGKRIDNGAWVSGALFQNKGGSLILRLRKEPTFTNIKDNLYELVFDFADVDPETVGQLTGLTDVEGRRIFEGDLIQQENFNGEEYTAIYEVVYDTYGFCLKMLKGNAKAMQQSGNSAFSFEIYSEDKGILRKGSVIGNIHDNPSLLK